MRSYDGRAQALEAMNTAAEDAGIAVRFDSIGEDHGYDGITITIGDVKFRIEPCCCWFFKEEEAAGS